MSDSKYFTTTKKGEIFELKSELNSDKKEKKREAVKKVNSTLQARYILCKSYILILLFFIRDVVRFSNLSGPIVIDFLFFFKV